MSRIEKVREVVDSVLEAMTDPEERRCAYIHLYGVAQAAALIAGKRKENMELSIVAAMLHDLYAYKNMDPADHAHRGAAMAEEILCGLAVFSDEEIKLISSAVYHHSDKAVTGASFDEVLKDADVMQHVFYANGHPEKECQLADGRYARGGKALSCSNDLLFEVKAHERDRFDRLKGEFGLALHPVRN